jgi:hypothetical protein
VESGAGPVSGLEGIRSDSEHPAYYYSTDQWEVETEILKTETDSCAICRAKRHHHPRHLTQVVRLWWHPPPFHRGKTGSYPSAVPHHEGLCVRNRRAHPSLPGCPSAGQRCASGSAAPCPASSCTRARGRHSSHMGRDTNKPTLFLRFEVTADLAGAHQHTAAAW